MPEGLELNDVPVEKTPEQVTLILGSSGWIEERAREIEKESNLAREGRTNGKTKTLIQIFSTLRNG